MHAPKPQPRMVGCRPKLKPNRKHHKPQPGMEGQSQNLYPNTPTQDPSQGWQVYRTRVGAQPGPIHKRHTTVGTPLSIARALRQPVPFR